MFFIVYLLCTCVSLYMSVCMSVCASVCASLCVYVCCISEHHGMWMEMGIDSLSSVGSED